MTHHGPPNDRELLTQPPASARLGLPSSPALQLVGGFHERSYDMTVLVVLAKIAVIAFVVLICWKAFQEAPVRRSDDE